MGAGHLPEALVASSSFCRPCSGPTRRWGSERRSWHAVNVAAYACFR